MEVSSGQDDTLYAAKSAGEIGSVIFDEPLVYDIYAGKNQAKQPGLLKTPPCKIWSAGAVEAIQDSFITKTLKGRYDNGGAIEGERESIIALSNLLDAAVDAGFRQATVRSGYRSFSTQTLITSSTSQQIGVDQAAPGRSEHQIGTAFDIGWDKLALSYRELATRPDAARFYQWLQRHAHEYGFVISYPFKAIGGVTNEQAPFVTEYVAEPWHIRYVTKPFAISIWYFKDAGGNNYLDPSSQLTPADFYRPALTVSCLP